MHTEIHVYAYVYGKEKLTPGIPQSESLSEYADKGWLITDAVASRADSYNSYRDSEPNEEAP